MQKKSKKEILIEIAINNLMDRKMNSGRMSLGVIFLLCIFYSCAHQQKSATESSSKITVMSYNLRYDNPGDSLNSWDHRKERLVNEVMFYNPDFMGIQEGLHHQVEYLSQHLPGRKYIGVGRKDGKQDGEYSAIFYNADQFHLVPGSDSTMWLSKTPGKPSRGWDAALPRIVTWGAFQRNDSDKTFYVFNTHFDHKGEMAREKSASLILKTIQKVAGDHPVALAGDFNVPERKKPYKILTGTFMKDARKITSIGPIGPEFTNVISMFVLMCHPKKSQGKGLITCLLMILSRLTGLLQFPILTRDIFYQIICQSLVN